MASDVTHKMTPDVIHTTTSDIAHETYLTGQYVRLAPKAEFDVAPHIWLEIQHRVGQVKGGILGPALQVAVDFGEPRPNRSHDCGGLVPSRCGFWFMATNVDVLTNYDAEAKPFDRLT